MKRKQIENIVWHIETNRRVAGDKRVLDDVLKSLKNFLKETAQEVPVQEQYEGKCSQCSKENKISLPQNIIPKYCMSCGNKITYIKKDTFYQK